MEVITKVFGLIYSLTAFVTIANAQIVQQNSNGALSKTASDSAYVNVAGDTMTGPLTLAGSSLTVTGNGEVKGDLTMLRADGTRSLLYTPATDKFQWFRANGTTVDLAIYHNTADNSVIENTAGALAVQARDGISLYGGTGVTQSTITLTNTGSVTIPGSSFSVGGSTLVVSNGRVGVGATSSTSKFLVSSPDAGTSWDSAEPLVTISNLDQNSGQAWGLLVRGGANGESTKIMEAQTYAADSAFTIQGNGLMYGYSRTLAQIDAITPGAAGGMVTCSNCSAPYTICMSTGTGRGAFVNLNTTNHCN